jgi:hypothetical protein
MDWAGKGQTVIVASINPADKYPMFVIPSRIGIRDDGQAGHVVQFFKPNGATLALSSGGTGCRIESGMTGSSISPD